MTRLEDEWWEIEDPDNALVLIACSQAKGTRAPARDLYTGKLFQESVKWAESWRFRWMVLSALHGLVAPETELDTYDRPRRPSSDDPSRVAWLRDQLPQGVTSLIVLGGALYVQDARRLGRICRDGHRSRNSPNAGMGTTARGFGATLTGRVQHERPTDRRDPAAASAPDPTSRRVRAPISAPLADSVPADRCGDSGSRAARLGVHVGIGRSPGVGAVRRSHRDRGPAARLRLPLVVAPMTSTAAGRAQRYYDGSPGRELITCPDCGEDADSKFGDHGGPEVCARRVSPSGEVRTNMAAGHARLAEAIIRETATRSPVFSANLTRQAMDDRHIPVAVRIAAFRRLAGVVMVPVGSEPSTEKSVRGRPPRDVRTYKSLVYTGGDL